MKRKVTRIVIHCSATKESQNYTFEQLTKDHLARKFKKCGYHRYIKRDGTVWIGRGFGEVGAHAGKGFNSDSIGICYEGGLDFNGKAKDTRTPLQKSLLIASIIDAINYGDVTEIVGHRDLSPDLDGDGIVEPHEWIKQCPCFNAIPEYIELLSPINQIKK